MHGAAIKIVCVEVLLPNILIRRPSRPIFAPKLENFDTRLRLVMPNILQLLANQEVTLT